MAIAPTGTIYKSLSFDNVSSRNYGVYITGKAVYNAPERDAEMITIPGRNGAFALDNGRFQNIEVTYPAGIFAESETDFAAAVSDFRNFLCSKKGYCRLTDEYNPNEYRMAVYKSGLEVEPAQLRAGEFEITFECKPQRFLTSGETGVAVASGGTITNPTLFPSSPMLEVKGYGNIEFNGYSIDIYNETLGNTKMVDRYRIGPLNPNSNGAYIRATLNHSKYNNGDTITVTEEFFSGSPGPGAAVINVPLDYDINSYRIGAFMGGGSTNLGHLGQTKATNSYGHETIIALAPEMPAQTFTAGTPKTVTTTLNLNLEIWEVPSSYTAETITLTVSLYLAYDGNNIFDLTISRAITGDTLNVFSLGRDGSYLERAPIYVDSSVSTLGNPTYIDCDLGIAYMIKGGQYVSLNDKIDLGAELPELAPGSNTVTFDNTVTELKIVPKWWKV